MPLDLIPDISFLGPALPEPFVRFELEAALNKAGLLSKMSGDEGRILQETWDIYRRQLRALVARGGPERVRNHVLEPLVTRLGYTRMEDGGEIETREGYEHGGFLMITADGATHLRVWTTGLDTDLDAPARRGAAYRYSHTQIAKRVLHKSNERIGLLTNGSELRVLIADPTRDLSQIIIPFDPFWKRSRTVPDSYRLLLALAKPTGVCALSDLVEQARLHQARVTKELRIQARQAIEGFIQEVLDHPANRGKLEQHTDRVALANGLWREGLIIIYRLLFILKSEASDDPARAFSFASTSLWRNTFSPSIALAPLTGKVIDEGIDTGRLLEDGVRALFRMFSRKDGLHCTELHVEPLGGMLFGEEATPLLSDLHWGERAVAQLLDKLLWTPKKKGTVSRERVHYGPLDVEDLGRIYEALLELEPGITSEPMCRLRRQKLEVVVPLAQGEKYRRITNLPANIPMGSDNDDDDEVDEAETNGAKTKVAWIEEIRPGKFYLRVGLGRKATGSYYTPNSFVRFLVKETLESQVAERSPKDDPQPGKILELKVLDPATGSGHFLVEACRFLGGLLYEACRQCDILATEAEEKAQQSNEEDERVRLLTRAMELRKRVHDLPDPDDALERYLPSRVVEGDQPGVSQRIAEALCRRLVAVHCLYGVDKNPLAIGLAKLSLWIEAHAEGLPLTFLDHRLVVGDSLTGPFFEHLLTFPGSEQELNDLFSQGLRDKLVRTLKKALKDVKRLEGSVGINVREIEDKQGIRANFERTLAPFKVIAAAWAGGVMLREKGCDDDAYTWLVAQVTENEEPQLPADLSIHPRLLPMIARGLGIMQIPTDRESLLDLIISSAGSLPALPYDLTFPEVFFPQGTLTEGGSFNVVLGNPPWEKLRVERRDIVAALDPRFLSGREVAGVGDEHDLIRRIFDSHPVAQAYESEIEQLRTIVQRIIVKPTTKAGYTLPISSLDAYHLFLVKIHEALSINGVLGLIVGGGLVKSPTESGLRDFVFQRGALRVLAHFFNLKQLFWGASSRISFVILIADHSKKPEQVLTGFDLRDFSDLPFEENKGSLILASQEQLLARISVGERVTENSIELQPNLLDLQNSAKILDLWKIQMSEGLHRTENKKHIFQLSTVLPGCDDARLPEYQQELIRRGAFCLYAGRSMDAFDSLPVEKSGKWTPQVDLVVTSSSQRLRNQLQTLKHYRLVWRNTCGHIATNERSAKSCLLPPGVAAAGSLIVETSPTERPTSIILVACSVINSYTFDFQVRQVVQTNFNKAILAKTRWPTIFKISSFLSHSALRLTCNHAGYEPLWHEQIGSKWHETTPPFTWPVLIGDDMRWQVRAAIDAVVANAYNLSREQYAHVLSTFTHKSYPKAPKLCLAMFDELKMIGLEAFTQKYDPYWDIPLNEALPQPIIELPLLEKIEEPKPQLMMDLEEGADGKIEPADSRKIIDFTEATRLRQIKKVAETPTEYKSDQKQDVGIQQFLITEGADVLPSELSISPIDQQVILIARAIQLNRQKRLGSLGRTKTEKMVHVIENLFELDFGRTPEKYAAGPLDLPHYNKVMHRAEKLSVFKEQKSRGGKAYYFVPLGGLARTAGRMAEAFGALVPQMDHLIEMFLSMELDDAEINATLYAVWNDLLATGETPDDKRIVDEFYKWDVAKKRFQEGYLRQNLLWMRELGLIPSGHGKIMRQKGSSRGQAPDQDKR